MNKLPKNWVVQCPEDYATNEGWKKVIEYINSKRNAKYTLFMEGNCIYDYYGMFENKWGLGYRWVKIPHGATLLTIPQFLEMTEPEQAKETEVKDWLDSEEFHIILSSFKGDDLHDSDVIDAIRDNYFPTNPEGSQNTENQKENYGLLQLEENEPSPNCFNGVWCCSRAIDNHILGRKSDCKCLENKPEEPPQQYEPGKYMPKFGERALFWNGSGSPIDGFFMSYTPQMDAGYCMCSPRSEEDFINGKNVIVHFYTSCGPIPTEEVKLTESDLQKARKFLAKEKGCLPEQIQL